MGEYDAVVIATPLELSEVIVSGYEGEALQDRLFQDTHSTFVKGSLRQGREITVVGLAEERSVVNSRKYLVLPPNRAVLSREEQSLAISHIPG